MITFKKAPIVCHSLVTLVMNERPLKVSYIITRPITSYIYISVNLCSIMQEYLVIYEIIDIYW